MELVTVRDLPDKEVHPGDATNRAVRVNAVAGTITANIGTTGALALDATLTGGIQKAIARGGQKGSTNTNADITHTASGANHEALDVAIYDGAGNLKDPTQIRALTATDVVSATQGTAAAASAAWPIKLTDGTSITAVKAASTAAAAADPAAVVSLSPNSPLPAGSSVIGALTANQSVNVGQIAGTTTGTVAAGVQKVGLVDAANVAITQVAKGTQAANFLGIQDAKDSGRVNIMWTVNGTAATQTAEALVTVTESRDGAAVTTFTSKAVTSGKRLRLTSVTGCIELTTGQPSAAIEFVSGSIQPEQRPQPVRSSGLAAFLVWPRPPRRPS